MHTVMGYCQEVSVKILMPWFVSVIWYSVAPWRREWEEAPPTLLPLLTSPSKALTRGHCSGGEEKKHCHSQHNEETLYFPQLLKQKQILLGRHYSLFLCLFSICAHLSQYSNMSASVVRICITQSLPSATQGPHFCRSTPICQYSSFQSPPNEPVFVWTFSVAFELISSIS